MARVFSKLDNYINEAIKHEKRYYAQEKDRERNNYTNTVMGVNEEFLKEWFNSSTTKEATKETEVVRVKSNCLFYRCRPSYTL